MGTHIQESDLAAELVGKQNQSAFLDSIAGGSVQGYTSFYMPHNIPIKGTDSIGNNPDILNVSTSDHTDLRSAGAGIRLKNSAGTTVATITEAAGVDVNGNKVTSLANGTNAADAVNKSQLDTKETTIAAGTSSQYYRGDKTMQALNQDAVPDGTTNKAYTATEKTKVAGIATGATANDTDANLKNRTNHTGAQAISTVTGLQATLDGKYAPGGTDVAVADGGTGASTAAGARTNLGLVIGTDVQAYDPNVTLLGNTTTGTGSIVRGTSPTLVTPALGTPSAAVLTNATGLPVSTGISATGTPSSSTYLRGDGTWSTPSGGSGDSVSVNGVAATDANLSDSVVAAPAGGQNVKWQKDSSTPNNVSAYIDYGYAMMDAIRKKPIYYSDFAGLSSSNMIDPFSGIAIASGTINAPNAGRVTASHPGQVRLRSSTTTNSGYTVALNTAQILLGGGEVFECIWMPEVFTATTTRMGFLDTSSSADAADGAYIEIDSAGVATGKTATANTRSSTGTTYTLTVATWYRSRVTVNAGATSITFEIFNDSGTLLWTDTLTTNIPTATGRETGAAINTTNSGVVATDLIHLDYQCVAFGNGRALTR